MTVFDILRATATWQFMKELTWSLERLDYFDSIELQSVLWDRSGDIYAYAAFNISMMSFNITYTVFDDDVVIVACADPEYYLDCDRSGHYEYLFCEAAHRLAKMKNKINNILKEELK